MIRMLCVGGGEMTHLSIAQALLLLRPLGSQAAAADRVRARRLRDQEVCAACGEPARRIDEETVVFCEACTDQGFLDELSGDWDDLGGG
jgi:hypothetical protein